MGAGDDAPYLFLHLTFQEYLSACHLSRCINPDRWDAELPLDPSGRTVSARDFVDRKAWLPSWQEVIVLLAGNLDTPVPLLELLSDDKKDDTFRHRLTLAGLCLPEIKSFLDTARKPPPDARTMTTQRLFRLRDEITTKAFCHWWCNAIMNARKAVRHLDSSLAATNWVHGRLIERLLYPPADLPTKARGLANARRAIGMTRTDASLPQCLAALLRDPEENVRRVASHAVGSLGAAAATPKLLATLAQLLRDPQLGVRYAAAEAVGGLGTAAATPEFLATLAQLLRDPDGSNPDAAVRAMGGLGAAAATPEFLAALAQLFRDPDSSVRYHAVRAMGGLGAAAATPELLATLAQLLRDPDGSVPDAAVRAMGGLGAAAATPELLATLAQLLRDPEISVRIDVARAVGGLGAAAATPELLALLAQLLRDPDWGVRAAAVSAMGGLGAAAATPELLATLAKVLRGDRDSSMRAAAAKTVGGLGAAAATPELLAALAQFLRDPNWRVRAAAAEAICTIMRQGVRLFFRRRWFRRTQVVSRSLSELAEGLTPGSGVTT
jgi:HEAT repeat protein